MNIKFLRPYYTGNETRYIEDSLSKSKIYGEGYYTHKVQKFIEKKFRTQKALLVPSCSAALNLSTFLLDIEAYDEVIMPSFTFMSTANSVLLRGGKIVFVDIDTNTMNIDPSKIEEKITSKTKAIYVVHYAGVSCDMDKIKMLAKAHNIVVIEDAAQAVNSKYKGQYLGTIGDLGCYSFHETKNYNCGEGGAILINTNNVNIIDRAEIIREKGTNKSKKFRGEVTTYTWLEIGDSFVMSDILSAFLYAQLEELDTIKLERKRVFDFYYNNLIKLENELNIKLQYIPEECDPNYHIFFFLVDNKHRRNIVIEKLTDLNIEATFHYVPLHITPLGKKLGYKEGDLPKTEDASQRLIRLPIYPSLKDIELQFILDNLVDVLKKTL